MINIIIKSKSYHPITSMVDDRMFKIPSKGKELNLMVTQITEHMKELEANNLIQIIKK